jgi:hypothetical protein
MTQKPLRLQAVKSPGGREVRVSSVEAVRFLPAKSQMALAGL